MQNFYYFLLKYLNIVFSAIIILLAGVKQMFLVNLSLKHDSWSTLKMCKLTSTSCSVIMFIFLLTETMYIEFVGIVSVFRLCSLKLS